MRAHKLVENKHTATQAIQLMEDPYNGMIVRYDEVKFEEDKVNDELCIKFEYDILDDADLDYNTEELEQYLGDFLQELIIHGLENNDITYTGGKETLDLN